MLQNAKNYYDTSMLYGTGPILFDSPPNSNINKPQDGGLFGGVAPFDELLRMSQPNREAMGQQPTPNRLMQ